MEQTDGGRRGCVEVIKSVGMVADAGTSASQPAAAAASDHHASSHAAEQQSSRRQSSAEGRSRSSG